MFDGEQKEKLFNLLYECVCVWPHHQHVMEHLFFILNKHERKKGAEAK